MIDDKCLGELTSSGCWELGISVINILFSDCQQKRDELLCQCWHMSLVFIVIHVLLVWGKFVVKVFSISSQV